MPPITRKKVMRETYKNHIEKLVAAFKTSNKSDIVELKATKQCILENMLEVKKLDVDISELLDDDDDLAAEMADAMTYSSNMTSVLAVIDSHVEMLGKDVKPIVESHASNLERITEGMRSDA